MNIGQIIGGISTASIPDAPPAAEMDASDADFWGKVDEFKRKADEAYTLFQRLRDKKIAAMGDPNLRREYDDVMGEANEIQDKISDVERMALGVREGAGGIIKGWFGLEGYNHAMRQLGQLGFVQVLAVGAVAAAIAWVGTWVSKAYILDRKLTAVENLHAQGVPISEAGKIITERGDPGPLDIFAGAAGTGVALAGLAAVVLYFFFEKKRGF